MSKYKWGMMVLLILGLFISEYYFFPDKKDFENIKKDSGNNTKEIAVQQSQEVGAKKNDTLQLTWLLLKNIDYVDTVTEQYPQGVMNPIVNEKLKKIEGQYIIISGYAIPMDDETYALSENVMASCFFCGMAGPESIMGIAFKDKAPNLETDQFITLIGKFDYNDSNPDDWIYHIKDAKLLNQ